MTEQSPDVTLDEVKERARLAGLSIPANRLSLVRGFLVNALRPDPRPGQPDGPHGGAGGGL